MPKPMLTGALLVLGFPITAQAQTLRSFEFQPETIDTTQRELAREELITGRYEVFADGNIKDLVGGDASETTASGSLGVGYSTGQFTVSLLVNAVGTATPLRSNFGSALLAPAAGTSLNAGVLDVRLRAPGRVSGGLCGTYGVRGYASVSSSRWQPDTTEVTYGVVTPGAGVSGFCQLLAVREVDTDGKDRIVTAVLDLGLAVRGIAGDIAQTANDSIRTQLLAEDNRTHVGVEVGLALQLNGLKAGLTLYAFPGEIPGLSDGQVVAGFSVQSGLFSGSIRRPATEADRRRLAE